MTEGKTTSTSGKTTSGTISRTGTTSGLPKSGMRAPQPDGGHMPDNDKHDRPLYDLACDVNLASDDIVNRSNDDADDDHQYAALDDACAAWLDARGHVYVSPGHNDSPAPVADDAARNELDQLRATLKFLHALAEWTGNDYATIRHNYFTSLDYDARHGADASSDEVEG